MCQPTEAKRTHPQLPTQLVSFSFDLGGVCSIFILVFPASGFFFHALGFWLVGFCIWLSSGLLTALWVFPFISKKLWYCLWDGLAYRYALMCLVKVPWLVWMRRPLNSPFRDASEKARTDTSPWSPGVQAFNLFPIQFSPLCILLFPSHNVWVTY